MVNAITRRDFLAGAAAIALAGGERASALPAVTDPLAEFDYAAVELTGGPLKRQYDRMHAAYLALDNDRLLKVYRERAGLPAPGEPMGGWYGRDGFVPGHSLGQYISGLARIGRTHRGRRLRDQGCGPRRRLCGHSGSQRSVLCRTERRKRLALLHPRQTSCGVDGRLPVKRRRAGARSCSPRVSWGSPVHTRARTRSDRQEGSAL